MTTTIDKREEVHSAEAPSRRAEPRRRRISLFPSVSAALSWLTVVTIVVPLILIVVRLVAEQAGSNPVAGAFSLPGIGVTLINTALVILASSLVALVVACGLAWLNERTNARMGLLTDVLPVVPMLVPSIAGAIGWVLLASPTAGFINVALQTFGQSVGIAIPPLDIFSWPGLIFVYSIYMVPQIYLTVSAALRNLDPALEEAARVNGAGTLRVLRTVTFPAVKPAILSGALLAFAYGIALFSVPLIIGTQARIDVITVRIVQLLTYTFPPQIPEALVLSLVIAAVMGVLWWVNFRAVRSGRFATVGGKSSAGSLLVLRPMTRLVSRIFMVGYLCVVAVLPLLALIIVSFQGFWSGRLDMPLTLDNYRELFRPGSQTLEGLLNSLSLGLLASTVAMVLAVMIWYQVSGKGPSRLGGVIDGATKLPATISNIIFAVALLAVLGGPPFNLGGTLFLLMTAFVILYIPQATLATQSANQMIGRELSEASWVSGEGPGATVRKIVLPLARPGLMSGWVFVFVLVVGDITASALLASPGTPVVGFVITSLFENGSYPLLAGAGAIISVASSVIVLSVLAFTSKRRAFEK